MSPSYTLIDLLSVVAALAAVFTAAAIDYKTLRIPNRLTFPFIFLGLLLMAIRCLTGYSPWIAALTCVTAYLSVYALWRCRLWGGGDAKLVLALFMLVSPAYPTLTFIVIFSLCLAVLLFIEHTAIRIFKPQKDRHVIPDGRGNLSAEDIASLCEPGTQRPMGPVLLLAYLLSIFIFAAGLMP